MSAPGTAARREPDVPMSGLTTFRLGGPCREFLDCRSADELVEALRDLSSAGRQTLLIGGGSNLLVADRGIDATVIRYQDTSFRTLDCDGGLVRVSGAVILDDLAAWTANNRLEGLNYCSGIPGTVGGAVAGNAGAFGEQIGDRVVSATVADRQGEVRKVDAAYFQFAYRSSVIGRTGDIILDVTLRLESGDAKVLEDRRQEILQLRRERHPDWRTTATAGSFFKNIQPTSKAERRQAAGWYLDQVGAREKRIGGAHTFHRHANIVVADPGCSAADVVALTAWMAWAVQERFGIALEREVRLLGF